VSVSSQSMISKSGTLREDVVLSSPAFIWLEKSVVNFYCAMLCIARTMLSQDVRPSVETAKRIRKLFSPSGNYTILVFLNQTIMAVVRREPLTATSNAGRYEKIAIFGQYLTLSRK